MMDERSPLIKPQSYSINDSATSTIPIYDNDRKKKTHFTFVLPALEDEKTHKDRYFSIRLCYICMFLSSVSFTICISSIWPFLQIIDITTNTSFFGWIVAGFSIGQLIGSPLFGYWSAKIVNHKIPMLTCLIITLVANILYAYLQSIDINAKISPKFWMLVSRFFMGFGASCAAIVRSYVSGATSVDERTAVLTNISACQGLGFIIGPVLQAALVPLHYPGPCEKSWLHFNMYTSPAYLTIAIYVILIIVLIVKFNEYLVLNQGAEKLIQTNDAVNSINSDSYVDMLGNLPPPDRIAIIASLALFFICCFLFSFYETLSSPLTIDMYAWTKSEATLYNGIILGGFGLLAVFIVFFTKSMAKKFPERLIMTIGYVILLVAVIGLLPWGHDYPSVMIPTIEPGHRNITTPAHNTTSSAKTSPAPRGCPLEYDWCFHTPIVKFYQFIIGFLLLVGGYSVTNVMSFTIYSKLLGPWPQGTMMGMLTSIGSLARALGPIVVSYLYGLYGPRVSFLFLIGMIVIALTIIAFTYKRYKPYKMP